MYVLVVYKATCSEASRGRRQSVAAARSVCTHSMERDSRGLSKRGAGGWRARALRVLRLRLPLLEWAPRYSRLAAAADLVAGVTLGLTLVPQSIAYASLANLPVQYGLYSAFVGTILYVFLGTVKEVSIGPTSLMALLTLQTCRGLPIEYVVLLTFLSGCVVLLMGLLRLGFLVELISPSVTSGFTSGTAVIIVISQLKGVLGLSFVAESVPENLTLIAQRWQQVRVPDVLLSAGCCTALLLLRKLKDLPVHPKRHTLRKVLWLISISRNALVVCTSSVVAFCLHQPDQPIFKLSGRVTPGLPPLSLPPFSVTRGNRTEGFLDMARTLSSATLLMPVVMVLANIAIAKAFSGGGKVRATQEMLTLGLCNMAGSLVHAMPTCGAFTRSAVSHASAVRSPAAGLYSGIITLLALVFLTEYFYFIPKACLSSVLICAVVFMIDVSAVRRLWRGSRGECGVLLVTFVVSVACTVELAVLAGVAASLALLLRELMRPRMDADAVETERGRALVVRAPACLVYLGAEHVAGRLLREASAGGGALAVDCARLAVLDYTAAQAIKRLIDKCKAQEQKVVFYNASGDVAARLQRECALSAAVLAAGSAGQALAAASAPAPASASAPASAPLLAKAADA